MSDWREIVQDQVDANGSRQQTTRIGLHFPPTWARLVKQAAAARGMSYTAYVRRAAMSFAAYDMQVDLYEVLGEEPPTCDLINGTPKYTPKRGRGYGLWRIMGLGK